MAENNFSFAAKYNARIYDVDTTGFEFMKLEKVLTEIDNGASGVLHLVNGLFVTPSPYGEQGVLICANLKALINLPIHMTPVVEKINNDAEAIDAINNGKVGFIIDSYTSHERICYNVKFVDL